MEDRIKYIYSACSNENDVYYLVKALVFGGKSIDLLYGEFLDTNSAKLVRNKLFGVREKENSGIVQGEPFTSKDIESGKVSFR